MNATHSELMLGGLDGANPLAFLAGLGALRGLAAVGQNRLRLSWRCAGAWRPVLHCAVTLDSQNVVAQLHTQLLVTAKNTALQIGDDLSLLPSEFRAAAQQAVDAQDALAADLLAAFGCDALQDERGLVFDTALRTMSGAGHQHFLKTMRDVLSGAGPEHLHKTLFAPWRYDDPLRNSSLRFDPLDDKRYALRWDDPSGDPTRAQRGGMLAANALAVLGIALLPTMPVGGRLETTGFHGRRSNDCFWTWPIWSVPLTLDAIRSVLALPDIQQRVPDRLRLSALGIDEVFRSQRITVGKFRNFTPAQAP